jgi:3-oxosteroid 1-dehydrogenase
MAWDHSFDLVIVGSGAAGMGAALRGHDLGRAVVVLEGSDRYGGSMAMSGGVVWIPDNPQMAAKGVPDDRDSAVTYLAHITKGEVSRERLEAYVDHSKRVLAYLEAKSHVRLDALELYSDYYPEVPGGRPGGRSMEPAPFDGSALGDELLRLRSPHPQSQITGKFGITVRQAQGLIVDGWRSRLQLFWMLVGYWLRGGKRKRFGRDTHLCAGNALAARLRRSLLDRDVPVWLETPARSLVTEAGKVLGVVVERDGKELRIEARDGVLLAAGGFERHAEMRDQWQRHPITTEWSAGNLYNTGVGIRMGMEAGGDVAWMREAWWTPVTRVPREPLAWVLVVEKSLPGSILINSVGERFTNEAAPYVDVVIDMYAGQAVPTCWLVCDATYRQHYPIGPVAPGWAQPDARLPRRLRDAFLVRGATIAELAEKIGIDAARLTATIERFNGQVRAGRDEDYHRGESASDRYYGDTRVTPNPCLRALDTAPYYAIRVYPGDLGTKGGLVTDAQARVLDAGGQPIPGLFAAGNCSASVMGATYPGAGGTIGPALVFGFVAAETAASGRAVAAAPIRREPLAGEVEHARSVGRPLPEIWAFVENFENWAPMLKGYVSHAVQSPTESTWKLRGELGPFSRTVEVKVTITEWTGPRRVAFTLDGVDEAVRGGGAFDLTEAPGARSTVTFRFGVEAQGPMGPMINALLGPWTDEVARDLLDDVGAHLEAQP